MRIRLVVTCIVLCSAVWAPLAGAAYTTPTAGGAGGSAFTISCPEWKVLVGVRGRHGIYLDRIEPICVILTASGTWREAPVTEGGVAGGSGGQYFEIRCPMNQAVSGIQGFAGAFINQLRLRCRPLGADKLLTGTSSLQDYVAGGSGGAAYSRNCNNRLPGHGFTGRAGSYIDRLALVCDVPRTVITVIDSPGVSIANPELEEQQLDFKRAIEAGASGGSATWVEGGTSCEASVVFDHDWGSPAPSGYSYSGRWASFGLVCLPPFTAKADLKTLDDFQLKNGWEVKRVEKLLHNSSGDQHIEFTTEPQSGFIQPVIRVRAWLTPPGNEALLELRVIIEGPKGTNPYR